MLLVNYTAIVQFSIFSKNSLYPLQKTNLVPNRIPYWNQNFLTQIFTEIFLTSPPPPPRPIHFHFGRQSACHDITK